MKKVSVKYAKKCEKRRMKVWKYAPQKSVRMKIISVKYANKYESGKQLSSILKKKKCGIKVEKVWKKVWKWRIEVWSMPKSA